MRFFVFARSTIFCYALPQGDADCHVASLLAMTGENLLRVRVCQEVLPESVLAPAETHLSSACHCEPVRTLVWQSASPQESLSGCCCLGEFVMPYVFAEKTAFGSALLRGNGLPHLVAPKSAMPCSGQRPEQGNAPLWLLSPQRGTLCGAPMHWLAMTC